MLLRRRDTILGGVAMALGGAARPRLVARPELVKPYAPEREAALYPRPVPFLARYRRGEYDLGFVAAEHGDARANGTFALIDRAFSTLRPALAIVEGFPTSWGSNPPHILQKLPAHDVATADSYTRGEDIHAAALAVDARIPFIGGDLTDSELHAQLRRQGFRPGDIAFSAMFGPLVQDWRAGVFARPGDLAFAATYRKWADAIFPSYPQAPSRGPRGLRRLVSHDLRHPAHRGPALGGSWRTGRTRGSRTDRKRHQLAARPASLLDHALGARAQPPRPSRLRRQSPLQLVGCVRGHDRTADLHRALRPTALSAPAGRRAAPCPASPLAGQGRQGLSGTNTS